MKICISITLLFSGSGYFLKINSQQENPMCPRVVPVPYGRSLRYHRFKQKQGLFYSFNNPHSTMTRLHTTRDRDFLES